jgi:signal transduction histidine kinase
MSPLRRTISLSARLARMNLILSFGVLLLASSAFFTYDLVSYKSNLIANLETQAAIVGDSATTALLFNDPSTAEASLRTLQDGPAIVGAAIRTEDGPVFAKYGDIAPPRAPAHKLAHGETNRWWPTTKNQVILAHRVTFQGRSIGVVYIVASMAEMETRARQYLFIALAILGLCMIAGLGIGAASQRWLSEPIGSLAESARKVTRERDYTLRATIQTDSNEIRTLVEAFNAMLGQIQARDRALTEARDQLELRVAERTSELRTANRELEAFSYTVAHDLRNPLDSITGIAFLLKQSAIATTDEQASAMLEQLRASTVNMSDLIDDLLNFARATTTALKREPVDMSHIAREIAADLQRNQPSRDVHFVVHQLEPVMADPGLLRVVIDNLLRNAWKYSSHHASALIEFGGKVVGDGMIYFVRDDGAGFDAARKEQLFHPFQRLHTKGEFPGTGIGLATVQRILERMGGRIWGEGAVEVGAAFYFTVGDGFADGLALTDGEGGDASSPVQPS